MRARPRVIPAAHQYLHLRTNPVCAGSGALRPGRLVWSFVTSPTPLSRRYRLRVEYRLGDVPRVFVEEPDLWGVTDGRRLPHVYEQHPPRLCLYLPGTGEWTPAMRLDQTIVPWAILWLFYFEEWLRSNEWKGGGMHPEKKKGRRREGAEEAESD
jgi:hypothetical protein